MRLIKVNAIAFAKMMGCLMEGATCKEVAEETGLHYMTALSYIRELHREGAVHVSGWQQDTRGSHTIRVYKVGRRKDAARPVKSRAEVVRRYREKKKRLRNTFDKNNPLRVCKPKKYVDPQKPKKVVIPALSNNSFIGLNAFLYGAKHDSSGSKKISS